MFGHPALRKLLVLKFRGGVRAQFRKLRRPVNWIYMLVGLGVFVFWYLSIFLASLAQRGEAVRDPETIYFGSQAMLFLLTVMTVVGAFNHRGLYLPKEEIELAFSAPLSRSDLVRYRLLVNMLRSVLVGVVFGFLSAMRMPMALAAFLGTLVTISTLTVLGQSMAILLGGAENRLAKAARKLPLRVVATALAVVLALAVGFLVFGENELTEDLFGGFDQGSGTPISRIANIGIVHALLLPFTPWARAITAPDVATFLPWFGVCVALWIAAFELTARIPVDFRELSLATSADVARRLNRVRRGSFGASSAKVDKQALSWQVPWLFGRGPVGAVAWLKLGQIVRKARGTMLTSTLIVVLVTVFFTAALDERTFEHAFAGAALLATVGTLYLCMGLRFDFRSDLDLMSSIKTWPLPPWRIFLATILPEVALVSLLLWAAILVRAVWTGTLIPELVCVLAIQPLVTFTWVAVDNAVFLFSPLRYSPGQESALQHMGRSVYLLLLRGLVFGAVFVCAAIPVGLFAFVAKEELDWSWRSIAWIASAILGVVLLATGVALTLLGGVMLRRFDVARDRG
ncbi:MAG: hypothetical protein IPJ77_02235 [Planctomycetes bacterium]|nr:hypothetical protein [Planctomycetota bacterium]